MQPAQKKVPTGNLRGNMKGRRKEGRGIVRPAVPITLDSHLTHHKVSKMLHFIDCSDVFRFRVPGSFIQGHSKAGQSIEKRILGRINYLKECVGVF